jgi:hypothetical protein
MTHRKERYPCQMDADGGVIRSTYRPRKCCGALTYHYFVYDCKKYYLCAGHMATSGLLNSDGEGLDAIEESIKR